MQLYIIKSQLSTYDLQNCFTLSWNVQRI